MIHRQLPQRLLHTAAVSQAPPAEYDHAVGARVMTCDGHPGVVTAVHDGPFPGTEAYMVELDGGLGGGEYGPGQLSPAAYRTAGTAAADYPELTRALVEHPDPAAGHPPAPRMAASTAVEHEPVAGYVTPEGYTCPDCVDHRRLPGLDAHPIYPSDFGSHNADPHGELCSDCDRIIYPGHHHDTDECGHEGCNGRPDATPSQPTACSECARNLSQDAVEHRCVFCGQDGHHTYCCPDPDGAHVAALRAAGALVDDELGMFDPEDTTHEDAFKDHASNCPTCLHAGRDTLRCPEGERLERDWANHGARVDAYYNGTDIQPLCADCGRQAATVTQHPYCADCGPRVAVRQHKNQVNSAAVAGGHQMAWAPTPGLSPFKHSHTGTCVHCGHEATVTPSAASNIPGFACPVGAGSRDHARDTINSLFSGGEWDAHRRFMDSNDQGPHHLSSRPVQASAEMSLGETIAPAMTYAPGPTKPRSLLDNPGSSGWATGSDPNQWSGTPLYPLDQRLGSSYDSDVVNDQPIDCPHCFAEPGVLHHHTCPVATDGVPINPLPCASCGQHGHGWHWNDCPTMNGIADSANHFFPQALARGHTFTLTGTDRDANGHVLHDRATCSQCGTEAHIGPQGTTLHGPAAAHDLCTPPPDDVPAPARRTDVETAGEHGYAPDGRPIQHSIGAACPRCRTPMSQDAQTFGCVMCGQGDHHSYCCPTLDAHTATLAEGTLHAEPEAALPSTDGDLTAEEADPEALTPQAFTAMLSDFQSKAAHLDPRRSGAGPGDDDIAQAARAHLASLGIVTATADFSPAERRNLIEEGHGVRAANADRLDLTGTHYADLQALLDGAEEEDPSWLVAP